MQISKHNDKSKTTEVSMSIIHHAHFKIYSILLHSHVYVYKKWKLRIYDNMHKISNKFLIGERRVGKKEGLKNFEFTNVTLQNVEIFKVKWMVHIYMFIMGDFQKTVIWYSNCELVLIFKNSSPIFKKQGMFEENRKYLCKL